MRIVIVVAALALLAGCGEDDEQAAAPARLADLTVTVDRDGHGGAKPKTAAVRCESGTDSELCGAIDAVNPAAFEPTPRNVACTELYGGPQTATVKGTLRGEAIDARFSRVNGCEIARWARVERLLGAVG